jgi:hypothetical protein
MGQAVPAVWVIVCECGTHLVVADATHNLEVRSKKGVTRTYTVPYEKEADMGVVNCPKCGSSETYTGRQVQLVLRQDLNS